jgi:hypothetical protein
MKNYLLGLRSGDFNKVGNVWTTDPIYLYNNKFYKNYSYKRSPTGLNLIGDYTFVGTEMASPSQTDPNTEAHDPNAVYVTNYGEVVYESATPDLLRFIDTTSRIDIVSYKHAFTNLTRKRNTNI